MIQKKACTQRPEYVRMMAGETFMNATHELTPSPSQVRSAAERNEIVALDVRTKTPKFYKPHRFRRSRTRPRWHQHRTVLRRGPDGVGPGPDLRAREEAFTRNLGANNTVLFSSGSGNPATLSRNLISSMHIGENSLRILPKHRCGHRTSF